MAVSLRKGVSLFRSQLCRYRTASCICKKTVHSSAQTDTRDNSGEEAQTHFGFQTVSEHEKAEKVYEVFHNVASTYDVMNDAMSGGVHRLWKDYFIERLGPTPGTTLIDVAGGTGDIAFRFLEYVRNQSVERDIQRGGTAAKGDGETGESLYQASSHVTVCDINQAMLDVGKSKALDRGQTAGMSWVRGNAECLPVGDNLYDAYTVAFGIRNMTHMDAVLSEAYRVLKPGGRFMCLEFSRVTNPLFRKIYDEYSFQVIPVMGQVIAADWKSYQYLVESIRQFPPQDEFVDRIKEAGFKVVTYENLMGGIAAIHSGFKL
ncbi:hypothetical protein NP493_755g00001 [Ridgeia piscesae]|uniref:2-methoxy-6-polyprenyl-1,4-benzoquinol methylase, mitochondrial n=1 Tax=Ridgeia piscesae TaxID=27915 RepID=A0AAD9KPJ1_RIDPI|nr:hypothetical protein NP493_755g00001 [Ridgeia piscesae]